MTDVRPSSESQPTQSAAVSNLVRASKPMTEEQVQEFCARMSRGWKAVPERMKRTAITVPTSAVQQGASPDDKALADDLYSWIGETLDTHINNSPRQYADGAVREFLNVPCSNEDLLEYFRAFAAAYERMIRKRLEITNSPLFSEQPTDRTTIGMVSVQRERMAIRMNRLTALHQNNPDSADLFRLSEFAGCTAEELARYLNRPSDEIQQQIDDRWYDICESTTDI